MEIDEFGMSTVSLSTDSMSRRRCRHRRVPPLVSTLIFTLVLRYRPFRGSAGRQRRF